MSQNPPLKKEQAKNGQVGSSGTAEPADPARPVTNSPPGPAQARKKPTPAQNRDKVAASAPDALLPNAPRPTVHSAGMELRHKLIILSFILFVALPTFISGWYLWSRAEDQYISTVAFSVRQEEAAQSVDILGGITQLTGGTSTSDADILYDFLRSEDIVAKIDQAINLRAKFSTAWPEDFVFALDPSDPIEDLAGYWRRQVQVLYDTSTGLITLKVAAFSREDAYEIARITFEESSRTINRLSDIAREDATRFARDELTKAQVRLTKTRQALTAFRMRTQIVDPMADLSGQMGVLNSLQAQLAEELVSLDTLRENSGDDDQRVIQAEKKIKAIRARISEERAKFGTAGEGPGGENYAQLMAEYEALAADMEFAETAFRSAQTAYDLSVAEAQRQSRYLAAHIQPNRAESSIAPNRPRLLASVFGVLLLVWAIILLIYYSIRDRR